LPLPPATFHILVALADGERHGYAIMKAVGLGPGTLYGSLKRLLEAGLVAMVRAARRKKLIGERPA